MQSIAFIEGLGATLGMLGAVANSYQRHRLTWPVWLLSNVLLLGCSIYRGELGLSLMWVFYTCTSLIGLYRFYGFGGLLMKFLAWLLVQFRAALIAQAMKTPYFHLPSYMWRWWLYNGYGADHVPKHKWLKSSGRIHHILRADQDEHMHDHPADCRTFVLRGWYVEERKDGLYLRQEGDTATIKHGEYHRIVEVSPGGVWTLFCLGPKVGEWGFLVDGKKIYWQDYLEGPYTRKTKV